MRVRALAPRALAPALLALVCCPLPASGEGFLGGHAHETGHALDHEARSRELQAAMDAGLGCGPQEGRGRLEEVQRLVLPIWQALPRTAHGRVEWRWVRYAVHRYFMRRSGVLIRGLEPASRVNASHAGEAQNLRHQAPTLLDMVLDGHRTGGVGFSLQDIAQLVATLEQLVFDSESTLLEKVYAERGAKPGRSLDGRGLRDVLETFMVHWIFGDDEQGIREILKDRGLLREAIPHWDAIAGLVRGSVEAAKFERLRASGRGKGRAALSPAFSFEDAHRVVGRMGRSFASFWETTCQEIKTSLVAMDKEGSGRVRLSDFYGANGQGEWRFGESEAYLRELGALDESSPARGPQVIIPNYLQAASNCIVSRKHYLVCCANECEDVLGEVEAAVGAPLAQPTDVLWVVGNLTSYDDDAAPVTEELVGQLRRIASSHGGRVPLHGRLFAQWLHYVFPRECPFPHRAGTVAAKTPVEYGGDYIVTEEEMDRHVKDGHVRAALADARGEAPEAAEPWMSQWSDQEELVGDYSELRAPWERDRAGRLAFGGAVALAAGLLLAVLKAAGLGAPGDARSHSV